MHGPSPGRPPTARACHGEHGSCCVERSHVPWGLLDWLQSLPDAEQATAAAGRASRKKVVSLPAYGFGVGPTPPVAEPRACLSLTLKGRGGTTPRPCA